MPLACLIVADDLTGACDAAAPFARRGLSTSVALHPDLPTDESKVIALNTDTRDTTPDEIRRQIERAAERAVRLRPSALFKKIDSTLRGQAGVEIAAAVDAFGCEAAVVCPAFPQMHRRVKGGWLHVGGVGGLAPVEIVPYLRAQGVDRCAYASPDAIGQTIRAGARLIVLDAASDSDLDRILAAGSATGRRLLWAGSAGLAGALARRLPVEREARLLVDRTGPVLFAIGSLHPATLAQQAALVRERPTRVVRTAGEIRQALRGGAHALLPVPRGRYQPAELARRLAGARPAAVALSGGDTAALVCRAAQAERIELAREILPGVPWGRIHGGSLDGLAVATKSGGFGGENALIEVADFFTCPNR